MTEKREGKGLGQDVVNRRAYKSKPVQARNISAPSIDDLARECCGMSYWLCRRWNGLQTVPYWVASDGREFTACPKCGQAAK